MVVVHKYVFAQCFTNIVNRTPVLAVQPATLTSKNVLLKSILAWTCTNSHNYHTISVHKHFDQDQKDNFDQDQKDKYLKTSRKILSQEMPMCNMKALILII